MTMFAKFGALLDDMLLNVQKGGVPGLSAQGGDAAMGGSNEDGSGAASTEKPAEKKPEKKQSQQAQVPTPLTDAILNQGQITPVIKPPPPQGILSAITGGGDDTKSALMSIVKLFSMGL